MNAFPVLAALTGARAGHVSVAASLRAADEPDPLFEANEGLMDHELASADPIQAWLDRTLTPPAGGDARAAR